MKTEFSEGVVEALEEVEDVLNDAHSAVLDALCDIMEIEYIPERELENVENLMSAITTLNVDTEDDILDNISTVLDAYEEEKRYV